MTNRATRTVSDKRQVNQLVNWVDACACQGIDKGLTVAVDVYEWEEKRSNPQNSKIHVLFVDIQEQAVITMPGRRIELKEYSTDDVKALCVVWFANERELEGRPLSKPPRTVVCPITGERVTVRPSSRHTLDRVNNNKNYSPGNCRWATYKEQNNNRRAPNNG